jgi:hypothetical protein
MSDYFVVEPCQTAGGFEIKLKGKRIDLGKAGEALSSRGEVMGSSPVVLLMKMGAYSISVYGSGRMMVKGKKLTSKAVQALAGDIVKMLEKGGAIVDGTATV